MECKELKYLSAIPLRVENKTTKAYTVPYRNPIKKDIY